LLAISSHSGRLLSIYQDILQGNLIKFDDSQEHLQLLLSGLVVRQHGILQVRCKLYQTVFNLTWVQQHLAQLRPYAQALEAWEADPNDESKLLTGQTLIDAQAWSKGQRLGDNEHWFLAASEALDRRLVEDAL
jgi:hypothetical protein